MPPACQLSKENRMAFENAYLTEEEKQMFKDAGLTDPRGGLFRGKPFVPTAWTIDRENKIALMYCGIADREENWKETFVIFYKQIDKEHLINLILTSNYLDGTTDEMLKQKYAVDTILKWDIIDISLPKTGGVSKEEVFNFLSDALCAYGVYGDPMRTYTAKIKVVLDYKGELYYGN